MSGFTADWLALREHADSRARNRQVAEALALALGGRQTLRIVDLGAGTGANLRATAPLLPADQDWYLLDHAPDLTGAARSALAAWADAAEHTADGLRLLKDGRRITVTLVLTDLSRSLDAIGAAVPHLVTASAFFDLVSARFLETFAAECARLNTAFFTALTCDGRDCWSPVHGDDDAIAAAFRTHQGGDKGFGPALGNDATDRMETAFRAQRYAVRRGDSPWRLDPAADTRDAALVAALAQGTARAASADGRVGADICDAWARARGTARCEIGHSDLLALPRGWSGAERALSMI